MEISNLERYCIDASHLQQPSTNRFLQVNGKQPILRSILGPSEMLNVWGERGTTAGQVSCYACVASIGNKI